jgi:hypothetical protein
MTRVIPCLVLAVLVPVTVLHAQQRPYKTPAEQRAEGKCRQLCEHTVKCKISEPGCGDRAAGCLSNCWAREGLGNR